jgi:hypothetical protein
LIVTSTTTVRSRALAETADGKVWSALTDVTFRREDQEPDLRITEIMYNPPGGEDFEFLEIRNLGSVPYDLSLAYFEGIDYRFPEHTVILPGEFRVLIRNYTAYRSRYPEADFHGLFTGKLSDRGEVIALRNAEGALITSVAYDDANGWPLSADGAGDSLIRVQRTGDADDPTSWAASPQVFGSPATGDGSP